MEERKIMRSNKGSVSVWFLFIIVLGVVAGGVYLYLERQKQIREDAIVQTEARSKQQEEEKLERLRRLEEEKKQRLAKAEAAKTKKDAGMIQKDNKVDVVPVDHGKTEEKKKSAQRIASDDPKLKIFDQKIFLTGDLAADPKNKKMWHDMLAVACTTNAWDYFKIPVELALKDCILASINLNEYDFSENYKNPMLRLVVAVYQLIDKLPYEWEDDLNPTLDVPKEQSFIYYLLCNQDNSLMNLQSALTGKEKPEELLRILNMWEKLWKTSTPEFRKKYQSLALACALIDPEKREKCEINGADLMTMEQVYEQFCTGTESKTLKVNIAGLLPKDLIYIVDLPVPLSEMQWAQENMELPRAKWAETYKMLKEESGSREQGDYHFARLKEEGGDNRARSYFAVNTAKSNGIPAATVTGDGKSWFIFMNTDQTWLGEGRPAGYLQGKIKDPRTGEMVYETILSLKVPNETKERADQVKDLLRMHRLLALFGYYAPARALLEQAQMALPANLEVWEETAHSMLESGDKIAYEEWVDLIDSLRRRFRVRPEIMELADRIDREIIQPNRDTRKIPGSGISRLVDFRANPLTIDFLEKANKLLIVNKLNDVDRLFQSALKDYSKVKDSLKIVNRKYYDFAVDNPRYKKKVLDNIEENYRKNVETKSNFYFTIRREIEILKQIASFYRADGNVKKADELDKEALTRNSGGLMAAY